MIRDSGLRGVMITVCCYSEVVHYDEFLSLPALHVCKLISSDRLTVTSEEQVNEI